MIPQLTILEGDVLDRLATLPDESVQTVVTSPPYWGLRDYKIAPSVWPDGWKGCLGLEPTPRLFVEHMVMVFEGVRRVLDPFLGSGTTAMVSLHQGRSAIGIERSPANVAMARRRCTSSELDRQRMLYQDQALEPLPLFPERP